MNSSSPRLTAFRRLVGLTALKGPGELAQALRDDSSPILRDVMLERDAAMQAGDLGTNTGTDELVAAYLSTRTASSVLDALLQTAPLIPDGMNKILISGGTSAGTVEEGHAKVHQRLALNLTDAPAKKVATMVVSSKEFIEAGGSAAETLITNELGTALDSAVNAAILGSFDTPVILPSTGDPESDLQAALMASQPSTSYVALVEPSIAVGLSLSDRAESTMTVSGGQFIPGVWIVADDEASGMTVIPAGRTMVRDDGLQVRRSEGDSVQMVASPSNASAETPTATSLVSLFQSNSIAVLLERRWRLVTQDVIIVRVGES